MKGKRLYVLSCILNSVACEQKLNRVSVRYKIQDTASIIKYYMIRLVLWQDQTEQWKDKDSSWDNWDKDEWARDSENSMQHHISV